MSRYDAAIQAECQVEVQRVKLRAVPNRLTRLTFKCRNKLQRDNGLGVSQHAWGQACIMLSPQVAVLALASIAARHARGLVQSPGGLLRRMVELHEAGSLRLDKTLFGLADELTRQRSSTAIKAKLDNEQESNAHAG